VLILLSADQDNDQDDDQDDNQDDNQDDDQDNNQGAMTRMMINNHHNSSF